MQRDVPGMTRGVLAAFKSMAQYTNTRVRAISVGVNRATAPPGVPHNKPFIWRDEASDYGMRESTHKHACLIFMPVCTGMIIICKYRLRYHNRLPLCDIC
jgi:hypothetical protein